MNRPNGIFEVTSGIVDTDTYRSPVHFPFFATGLDGLHSIAKGSPLLRVIPFRRDATESPPIFAPNMPMNATRASRCSAT